MRAFLSKAVIGLVWVSSSWADDLASKGPLPGIQLEIRFGAGSKPDLLLNGLRIGGRQEARMTCPEEGSCAVPITIMAIAGVVTIAFLSEMSRHRDKEK